MNIISSSLVYFLLACMFYACNSDEQFQNISELNENIIVGNEPSTYKILSLGDSYTFGQSVCGNCNFPSLLVDSLEKSLDEENIKLLNIAMTGWTTTDLINAVDEQSPSTNFNMVTLLIGVNNQYQGKPFSLMESEFPQLLNRAINYAGGKKEKVIVLSIPDYAYTPFGQNSNPAQISAEIDMYNNYLEEYTEIQGITYFNITDITREGLDKPELVASDGLHPSEVAYKRFVDRIFNYVETEITE